MFQFLLRHPIPVVALVIGGAISVGSRLNDLYTVINAGLPHQVWEALGATVFFIGVVALLYRWDKEQRQPGRSSNQNPLMREEVVKPENYSKDDREKHERLELFLINVVRPAVESQVHLQRSILEKSTANVRLLKLAEIGLLRNWDNTDFMNAFEVVGSLGDSPLPALTIGGMIECITTLERGAYAKFCKQAEELAQAAGISIDDDAELLALWNEWRSAHNKLVARFDTLKSESRFGTPLYRPQRDSRWGGVIPRRGIA